MSKVTITVSGPVGCAKSALLGEIEILMKALGVPVSYADEAAARAEKNGTHADWTSSIEMYKPSVVLVEHIERESKAAQGQDGAVGIAAKIDSTPPYELLDDKIADLDNLITTPAKTAKSDAIIWRPVVGYESSHEVSSAGDIRNKKTNTMLAKNLMGSGYVKADLWFDGKRKQTSAHRLVAEAFIGPIDDMEINHINGVKIDNRVENLEIVTKSVNELHSRYALGHLVKRVVRISPDGEKVEYASINSVACDGFVPQSVARRVSGKQSSPYRGFAWKYKVDEAIDRPQPPALTNEQIELIAESWDGCMYDGVGGIIDIGASIRSAITAAKRDGL